jgi:hypothetical protein
VALEQTLKMVIEHMQVFNQQVSAVALGRRRANERTNFRQSAIRRLAALELRAGLTQLLANLV